MDRSINAPRRDNRGDTVENENSPKPWRRHGTYLGFGEAFKAEADAIKVGDRCEVSPGAKRGEVMFSGTVEGLPLGHWIGVRFDEPVGKNDGTVKGARVFECLANHGGFVRPTEEKIKVGDFPEIDEFAESDEEL